MAQQKNILIPIDQKSPNVSLGGKADGLYHLMHCGLPIPETFVIRNTKKGFNGEFIAELKSRYERFRVPKVAVRSSAQSEDSADQSFAGQYDTFLDVEGMDNVLQAIENCVNSLQSERAESYQQKNEMQEDTINVLVQEMVDARVAGVLFTADPASGRHDRIVIDVVEGLGESLVSGETTPDHFLLDNTGTVVQQTLTGKEPLLTAYEIHELFLGAQKAQAYFGHPIDMEWVINKNGDLIWLQARPITTLGSDLNELDTPVKDNHVITRCNIGEALPTAVCPLTFSVEGRGLEYSVQAMQVGAGARKAITDEWTQVHYGYGHIFINLTGSIEVTRYSLIATPEQAGESVCGQVIPELQLEGGKAGFFQRLKGTLKFLRFIFVAGKEEKDFSQKSKAFFIPYSKDCLAFYNNIDRNLHWINEANAVHTQSSAAAGIFEGIQRAVIARNKSLSEAEQQKKFAELSHGARWVESASVGAQIDNLASLIQADRENAGFVNGNTEEAAAWLVNTRNETIKLAYKRFIEAHGHRGENEECLQARGWSDNPGPLLSMLQARAKESQPITGNSHNIRDTKVGKVTRGLHKAIRGRESTKSLMIKVLQEFKRAYYALACQMEAQGLLEDKVLIYFFTHQELGAFLKGNSEISQDKLKQRRRALWFQQQLCFDEISIGAPQPTERTDILDVKDGLSGRIVCSGDITASCRVASTLSEAGAVEPGEILIAPATDVAWTPYFSAISGLVTDVGSTVSHGGIIAREYGLPCIVNTRIATQVFKTGDRVRLNAGAGWIKKLEEE